MNAEDRELEALELELLLTAVQRRFGYDFSGYSMASFKRRVRVAMHDENVATLSALQDRLLHDRTAFERFIGRISVSVTTMFRDPQVYRSIRQTVIPLLRTYPFVRIWVAGTSSGEEVYSMAIMLEEEGLYDRCRIYATDMSHGLLDRARRALFPQRAMNEFSQNYMQSGGRHSFDRYYVSDGDRAKLAERLKRNVVFSQHNLVSDGSFNEFHLVLCRNVMIYFDDRVRERALQLVSSSLGRLGVLVLGLRESIRYSSVAPEFQALDDELRVYRKVRE